MNKAFRSQQTPVAQFLDCLLKQQDRLDLRWRKGDRKRLGLLAKKYFERAYHREWLRHAMEELRRDGTAGFYGEPLHAAYEAHRRLLEASLAVASGDCPDSSFNLTAGEAWAATSPILAILKPTGPATVESKNDGQKATKPPRTRDPEEKRMRVVSELCRWNKYEEGICENPKPALQKDIAKGADVPPATATRALKEIFGEDGYNAYVRACGANTLGTILSQELGEQPSGLHSYQADW